MLNLSFIPTFIQNKLLLLPIIFRTANHVKHTFSNTIKKESEI